ncbi:MAG: DUF1351 domain-containing protein [Christensenellales bacterium]|jgi:hypothetical protein
MSENKQLIIIKQLPIIEERLKTLSDEIDEKVKYVKALAVTEDTVKDAKKVRAEIRKEFAELEEKRKEVKNAIAAPYNKFEEAYKKYISEKFKSADEVLVAKINEVEYGLKKEKEIELVQFFNEYAISKNIDFLNIERAGIKINLSASMKSLKDQSKTFINQVESDIAMIETQANKDEIMVEYKKTLNASQAITTIAERHNAMMQEQEERTAREQVKAQQTEAAEKVEQIVMETAPVEQTCDIEEEDPVLTLEFSVTAPLSKLKALKSFLIEGGYKYE